MYYYIKNLQGDVTMIVNASLSVVARYSYDPWGKCTVTNVSGTLGDINPLRYRGYYYDTESGFYYLESRYYDPEVCRFIGIDDVSTVTNKTTITDKNLYAYCDNNPINRTDDEGDFWNIVIGAAVGAVLGAASSIVSSAITGKKIDWGKLTISVVSGAISGGFAATGICVGGQMVINGLIGAATSAAETFHEDKNASVKTYATNIAVGAGIGVLSGWIGGNGTGNKHLSASAKRLTKSTAKSFKDVAKKGIRSTVRNIGKSAKYYYSQTAKMSVQCGKKAIRPIIKAAVPGFIHKLKTKYVM